MTQSWFDANEIPIRDDGSPEIPAEFMRDADGAILVLANGQPRLVLDEKTGEPKQQYQPARGAWPEDAKVIVKGRVDVEDYETIQRLQMETPTVKGNEGGMNIDAKIGIMYQPLCYGAVLIKRFEGEVFGDMKMPDTLTDRLALLRKLPLEVMGFIFNEINRRAGDPLEGTTPVETKPSADDTGRKPIPMSKSRAKTS